MLGLTDGNLSAHSRTLEESGYIVVEKTFQGRPSVYSDVTDIERAQGVRALPGDAASNCRPGAPSADPAHRKKSVRRRSLFLP